MIHRVHEKISKLRPPSPPPFPSARKSSPADDAKCNMTRCREGVREGTHGYQIPVETAPVLLGSFLITGLELWKARGDRNGGVRPWGGVRLTDFAFPQLCCCALFWIFFYGTYKERSPRCSIFLWALEALTAILPRGAFSLFYLFDGA